MSSTYGVAVVLEQETAQSLVSGECTLTFVAAPLQNLAAGNTIYFTLGITDIDGMHLMGCAVVDEVEILKKVDFFNKGTLHGLSKNYMALRFDENWQRRRLYAIYMSSPVVVDEAVQ